MQAQPPRRGRRGGLARPPPPPLLLLLLLLAAAGSFLLGGLPASAATAPAAGKPVAVSLSPPSLANASSGAYATALSALNAVVDAYSTKLATEKAALETAKLNHDAKAGLRVLATGKAADVAVAKARAQAVVGAALSNALGQKCPNGSYPVPFKQRLAAVKASNVAAEKALKSKIEGKLPTVSIRIGNNKTSQASVAAAKAAAGVVSAEAAALNATSSVWGPALTALFNGIGSIGNAKVAVKNATRNAAGGSLAVPAVPGRRRSLSSADEEGEAQEEDASSFFDAFDLDALDSTTDDVDGLLNDAASAYAESLLVALPWGGPANLTRSAVRAARSAKNATKNAVVAAGFALPPPINTTLASLGALSAGTRAKLLAHKQRADAAFDAATSEEAKEAVVHDVRTRVWAVVQALDPRMTANVTTGTGCVVPPGSYVRDTVVDGYVIVQCPVNYWCPGGPLTEEPEAVQCPAGTTTLGAQGAGSLSNCEIPPGSYLDPFGQIKVCERDFWCPGGPYDQAPGKTPCGAGNTTLGATGSTNAGACQTIDPCLAPGTCCQGASVFPSWTPSTPACSQQAIPSPACVNLNVDTQNCGSCANVCPVGAVCNGGQCEIPPGSFVDTTTDPNAPAITPCPAESFCPGGTTLTPVPCPPGTGTLGSPGSSSVGQCVPQDPCVPDPNTCCRGPTTQPGWPQYGPYFCAGVGGLCTNTAVDKNNCGSCGAACSADAAVACCSGSCTNLATSSTSCGACGVVCLGGSVCQAGTCRCPAGTTFSSDGKSCLVPPGKTVDPNGNVVTCPSDNWCPGGVYCTSGCAKPVPCGPGLTTFGATGQTSAGACQPIDPCLAPNTCCQGAQVYPPWSASTPACAGLTSPSPTCNNLAIDAANCGSCGAACPASTANTNIGCCSGVCKDLFNDDNNCGTCGNVCASPSRCELGQCAACLPATYIYGIADNKVIYETNVNAGTNRAVFDAKPFIAPGDPNAFAYDTARDDFFFLDSAKTLWYWNRQTPVLNQIATAAQMGINSFTLPANAVYYNNGFWFIKEGGPAVTQQTLIEIVFTYNANQDPVYSATKTFTFNIVNSNNQPTAVAPGFGDIAVANGIMYLATAGGVFYRFDMSLLPAQSGPATGPAVVIKTGNPSFQLSFSCDLSTLWAQQYDNNQWSTINTATGVSTPQFTLAIPGQTKGLRDLGGASCTCA